MREVITLKHGIYVKIDLLQDFDAMLSQKTLSQALGNLFLDLL